MTSRHITIEQYREMVAKEAATAKRPTRRQEELAAAADRRACYTTTTETIQIRLPLPPLLNHYYDLAIVRPKNRKPIIGRRLSAAGRAFREAVIHEWEGVRLTYPADLRLAIRVTVTFPDNRSRDLDGYWKALLDALEHAGAYFNDSQIKLAIIEQEHTESPGWVDVILGPKPGAEIQQTLFQTQW